jgi:hypothetical protein
MINITEGMTPTEFLEVVNHKFDNLDFLGYISTTPIEDITEGQEIVNIVNNNFTSTSFFVGMKGSDFSRIFEEKYSELFDIAIAQAEGDALETLVDTESLVGKTILPVGTYITLMNQSGDVLIEDKVIEGLGSYNNQYNPNPTDPIGIFVHCIDDTLNKVTIRRCIVKNINSVGIEVSRAKEVIFEDCHVENCNFVAYTPIAEKVTMTNCTSKLVRMHTETVTTKYDSWIRMKNCRATDLIQYMVRWWGVGTGYFIGMQAEGSPSYDYYVGQVEGYGMYIQTDMYSESGNITKVAVIDFTLNHFRVGIKLEPSGDHLPIDKFYHGKLTFSDLQYTGIVTTGTTVGEIIPCD